MASPTLTHPLTGPAVASPAESTGRAAAFIQSMPAAAWMTLDFLSAALSMSLACLATPWAQEISQHSRHLSPWQATLAFGFTTLVAGQVSGLHQRGSRLQRRSLLGKCILTALISVLALTVASSFVLYAEVGRLILLCAFALSTTLLYLPRAIISGLAMKRVERIALVGNPEFLAAAGNFIQGEPRPVYVRFFDPATAGEGASLATWARQTGIDQIVYQDDPPAQACGGLFDCLEKGLPMSPYSEFVGLEHAAVPVGEVSDRWWLVGRMGGLDPAYLAAKRCLDIVVASAGLILSAPLVALAALAIRLQGPGPTFYSQIRSGLRGEPFRIYKLRSMRTDAEKNGAQWAGKNDNRVTAIGKFLRKSRLDEVPQFWNIIKGDMSFIGPRPERPEFMAELDAAIPYFSRRNLVKPGLTGWAQINAGYGASIDDAREKLRYDLYYVKNASLEFDLHILIRTIGAAMKGAR